MKKKAFAVWTALVIGLWAWGGAVTTVAWAQEIAVAHGHSGHIEYPDRVDSSRQFLGWGLDFDQRSGSWNWIHYSIPVPNGKRVRYVGVLFATGSTDVSLTQIHVYNGSNRVHVASGLNLNGAKRWYVVDMGAEVVVTEALGISVEVGAGVEMMSHKVQIFSVGALYQ